MHIILFLMIITRASRAQNDNNLTDKLMTRKCRPKEVTSPAQFLSISSGRALVRLIEQSTAV